MGLVLAIRAGFLTLVAASGLSWTSWKAKNKAEVTAEEV